MKELIKGLGNAFIILLSFKKGCTQFNRWFEIGIGIIAWGYLCIMIYIILNIINRIQ